MNFQFYIGKLESSNEFKKFVKENPDFYLCSGFFVIDKENTENPDNKVHLDFYVPKDKKIFSFDLKDEINLIPLESFNKVPKEISRKCDFDFEEMEKLILEEMEKQNVKSKLQKIIFSLQNIDGKCMLLGAIFVSMLGILKIDIDISDKKIIKFEKKSLLDMFKVTGKKKD